ncbi:hypothetical protein [Rubellicoccus peritrichatus]|uniref:Holin n=1 Tax=Rubellicoccus peritrichatus TaxID=3080537 RepID=A0AAQ3LG03_9BACT|nr:hypothetical protein [Puniceicoccus sp. CR14]WOO43165.1 hypothetical protein RZN69_08670 [Puniceicoccus sp. CR14]
MPDNISNLGWKFFFGVLTFLQAIVIYLGVDTLSTLKALSADIQEVKQRQTEVIIVKLNEHDKEIDSLINKP